MRTVKQVHVGAGACLELFCFQLMFERYIAENLNDHRRGIFRQSVVSIDTVLSWTKVPFSHFYN